MAGNSVGELVRFDLRAGGGVAGRYKGFGGGVTAVDVSGDGSILAACGLDRYLRTYSLDRPKLLHQVVSSFNLCILQVCARLETQAQKFAQLSPTKPFRDVLAVRLCMCTMLC